MIHQNYTVCPRFDVKILVNLQYFRLVCVFNYFHIYLMLLEGPKPNFQNLNDKIKDLHLG